MKKIPLFAIALLVISFASCVIADGYEFQVYENSGEFCSAGGYVYMSDSIDIDKSILIETMLQVGEVWSTGGLDLHPLPAKVDSRFLAKLNHDTSPGMYTEPLDVEVLLYEKPLRLISDGMYLRNLEYIMIDERKLHKIFYWYFSKDAKINHSYYNSETETYECEYSIEARKGWNDVYFYKNIVDGRSCYTTDLSEVPDGLKWIASLPKSEKF